MPHKRDPGVSSSHFLTVEGEKAGLVLGSQKNSLRLGRYPKWVSILTDESSHTSCAQQQCCLCEDTSSSSVIKPSYCKYSFSSILDRPLLILFGTASIPVCDAPQSGCCRNFSVLAGYPEFPQACELKQSVPCLFSPESVSSTQVRPSVGSPGVKDEAYHPLPEPRFHFTVTCLVKGPSFFGP